MKFALFLFVLCATSIFGQNLVTWSSNYYQLLQPSKYIAYEYSTSAVDLSYSVSCSRECNIYLVTWENFRLFQTGYTYYYLNFGKTVSTFSYSNQQVIAARLVVLITNPSSIDSTYATSSMTQRVPYDPSSTIVGGILGTLAFCCCCCCCCFLCVTCIYGACRNNNYKSQYSYVHIPPMQGHVDPHQGVFTQGYYNNATQYPQPNQQGGFNQYSGTIPQPVYDPQPVVFNQYPGQQGFNQYSGTVPQSQYTPPTLVQQ